MVERNGAGVAFFVAKLGEFGVRREAEACDILIGGFPARFGGDEMIGEFGVARRAMRIGDREQPARRTEMVAVARRAADDIFTFLADLMRRPRVARLAFRVGDVRLAAGFREPIMRGQWLRGLMARGTLIVPLTMHRRERSRRIADLTLTQPLRQTETDGPEQCEHRQHVLRAGDGIAASIRRRRGLDQFRGFGFVGHKFVESSVCSSRSA